MDKMDKLLTIAELAEKLNVHRTSIHRYIKHYNLPYVQVGGQKKFRQKDVDKWLTQKPKAQ